MQKRVSSGRVGWQLLGTYIQLTIGALIGAIGVTIFLAPFSVAPGGVTGIAVILNRTVGTPIGVMVFLLNIPIQIIGYYMLPRGWRTIVRTVYIVVIYTIALDLVAPVLPTEGISDNVMLNALFGGVMGGIGGGIIIRNGGSFGGTSTLALIIQSRTGLPLSSIYLYTDSAIIASAGLIFGWEAALYASITLFVDGLAASYVLEGPSVIRTVVIITDKPQAVSEAILHQMNRGVTGWEATGMYTGQTRHVLYVTVSRGQVQTLRQLIHNVDAKAFIVIGHGHTAYGEGFKRPKADAEAVTNL